jgi:hypothetical protein
VCRNDHGTRLAAGPERVKKYDNSEFHQSELFMQTADLISQAVPTFTCRHRAPKARLDLQ